MAGLPSRQWLYFIVDVNNKSYFVNNGVVQKSISPSWMQQNPIGWKDIEISFATNQKYWSLNRAFSIPVTFINDGATILRNAMYKGKGYEDDLYLMIMKRDESFGIANKYNLEYKGKIDLGKASDDPTKGVTINTVEGGLLSYLNANDGITYEIDNTAANANTLPVYFDGVNLKDQYNYSFFELDTSPISTGLKQAYTYTIPFVFLNNEGDSVGIVRGDPTFEEITTGPFDQSDVNAYTAGSANYYFYSVSPISIHMKGTLSFRNQTNANNLGVKRFFSTSLGNTFPIADETINRDDTKTYSFEFNINLAAGEKLFLIAYDIVLAITRPSVRYLETTFEIDFTSVKQPTTALFFRPLYVLQELVRQMTAGKYTAQSNFLSINENVLMAGGQSLRNLPKAIAKTTFQDYYGFYDALYNMGVKVVNNVLYFEPKADLNNDATTIADLGELSEFTIAYATDLICNTAKFGYPIQDYQERNGRFEFNATSEFILPVLNVKKEYNKVTKYRGDCFGIEFLRSNLVAKTTTDDKGDNDIFVVKVNDQVFQSQITIVNGDLGYQFTFDNTSVFSNFFVGQTFKINSALNTGTFTVVAIFNNPPFNFSVQVAEMAVVETISATVTVDTVTLSRPPYTSMAGVTDQSVYNTEITPMDMLLAHGNYLRGLLFQLGGEKIKFGSSERNKDLVTVLNGVTKSQSADIQVGSLPSPLFLPYYFNFKTKVPDSFETLFNQMLSGNVKSSFNRHQLFNLPIGNMKSTPATNSAQEWKLLASPLNNLASLYELSLEGLFIYDNSNTMLFVSDLNPVHFVKYNYNLPLKYHHKGIYDDSFEFRNEQYITKTSYLQKWQKTDTISLQFVTKGTGIISVHVIDENGDDTSVLAPNIIVDPSVVTPYVLQQIDIDLTTYDGIYRIVLYSGPDPVLIGEWMNIQEDYDDTLLYEYYNTTNKRNTYFSQYKPMIRCEGMFIPWLPDSSFTEYENEVHDVELLGGKPYKHARLKVGNQYGIPDWMALKINNVLLLNRTDIDGDRYSRNTDSKFEATERVGYPMNLYTVDVLESINKYGLALVTDGTPTDDTIVYTLDAQSFGLGNPGDVVNIELIEQ